MPESDQDDMSQNRSDEPDETQIAIPVEARKEIAR